MALDLCFFNSECIAKRERDKAIAQQQIAQQQQLLMQISNQNAGGLNAWEITGIVVAVLGIAAFVIYKIKRKKSK